MEGARRKVLFVTGALSGGGAERFVSTALSHLDRELFLPYLALFSDEVTYELPDDVSVEILGRTAGLKKTATVRRLIRWINDKAPDVVVGSHWHVGRAV